MALIDWLIDLHCVWALMVLMHLGCIGRPFVPYNLLAAQDSPLPLPMFQMAPRLKILCPLVRREEPRYTVVFSQTVPASKSPPGSPTGPLWREIPAYRAFLHLSWYTGCHRRNGPNFGRVFLMLKYTDITQNTYIQSW